MSTGSISVTQTIRVFAPCAEYSPRSHRDTEKSSLPAFLRASVSPWVFPYWLWLRRAVLSSFSVFRSVWGRRIPGLKCPPVGWPVAQPRERANPFGSAAVSTPLFNSRPDWHGSFDSEQRESPPLRPRMTKASAVAAPTPRPFCNPRPEPALPQRQRLHLHTCALLSRLGSIKINLDRSPQFRG